MFKAITGVLGAIILDLALNNLGWFSSFCIVGAMSIMGIILEFKLFFAFFIETETSAHLIVNNSGDKKQFLIQVTNYYYCTVYHFLDSYHKKKRLYRLKNSQLR